MKTVNSQGFGHFVLLALLIVGIGVFGTFKMVTSNSQPSFKPSASRIALPKNTADCKTAVNAGPDYFFDGTRCVTLTDINCPAGTKKNTTSTPNRTYYCTGTAKVAAAKAPANTEQCVKAVGQTYFYNGTRCVTLIKPVCKSGTGLVTTKDNANLDVYYCKAGVKTPKVKATYTLSYGVRPATVETPFVGELTTQANKKVEFVVVVSNTSSVAIENVKVNINGLNSSRLLYEADSLRLDGGWIAGGTSSPVRVGNLPANTIKRVTFLAKAGDKVSACGNKKIATRVTLTAKAVPAQSKTTNVQVCP